MVTMMGAIKRLFDPKGILNPYKVTQSAESWSNLCILLTYSLSLIGFCTELLRN